MKLLIISDIHGNLAALDAIREEADKVFCLGDMVNYGPYPKTCLERVRDLTDGIVRGNHDNAIGRDVDCGCSVKYKELSDAGKIYTKSILSEDEKDYLANLPVTLHTEINGTRFLFSHGSPRGDMFKYLRPDVSHKELEDELKYIHADIVFIGHTHLPMVRKIQDILVVNPGSVGQPRDSVPLASYAVWEDGSITIKRVPYDIEATVKGLHGTNIPSQHVEMLTKILRGGGM
ncbi:MAG: metallophosphoesterase family protein [Candidatus Brocadiaceae bacterium]|uniref:metallophosphoesterase family protein n=1 Tax=Candidatus Wunengus sp. YC61 TaxID=3367698 RepID=UPI002718C96A|nr:metallophosphoesterase family protein [Candidatus Brocadiaceae bacterium]